MKGKCFLEVSCSTCKTSPRMVVLTAVLLRESRQEPARSKTLGASVYVRPQRVLRGVSVLGQCPRRCSSMLVLRIIYVF